jgi:hypothetical protein
VIFGSVLPDFTMLPVLTQIGSLDHPTSGPDTVQGFARDGRRLFAVHFSESGYSYYLFAPVPLDRIAQLTSLKVSVRGKSLVTTARTHGAPRASARALDANRVEVRWDASQFPRLACDGGQGGSPAPLMLGGHFTAANFFGRTIYCDFSDGVKTAFAGVPIRVAGR